MHAYLYLKSLPSSAMLHEGSVMGMLQRTNRQGVVMTKGHLQLPWDIFTLPPGVQVWPLFRQSA